MRAMLVAGALEQVAPSIENAERLLAEAERVGTSRSRTRWPPNWGEVARWSVHSVACGAPATMLTTQGWTPLNSAGRTSLKTCRKHGTSSPRWDNSSLIYNPGDVVPASPSMPDCGPTGEVRRGQPAGLARPGHG